MTSILRSFFNTAAASSHAEDGRRSSTEIRRDSLDGATKEAEMRSAVEGALGHSKSQPAVGPHKTRTNTWQDVFNPGKNFSMKEGVKGGYFDTAADGVTTWDHILHAENVRKLTFKQLDKNADGFIDAEELRHELHNSTNVESLIQQADKNNDGKIDYAEFVELFKNMPSA